MRSFCKGWGLINTVYVCQELVNYSDPVSPLEALTISVKGGAYTCCNNQWLLQCIHDPHASKRGYD